jgi:hypothetical protein
MAVKSEWKVQCNFISGLGRRYIAYRILNVNEPMHSGNIEHYGEYSENKEEIQKLVDELNAKEAT